jgi:hypothetical protein
MPTAEQILDKLPKIIKFDTKEENDKFPELPNDFYLRI